MLRSLMPDGAHPTVLAASFLLAIISAGNGTWLGARTAETAFVAG